MHQKTVLVMLCYFFSIKNTNLDFIGLLVVETMRQLKGPAADVKEVRLIDLDEAF